MKVVCVNNIELGMDSQGKPRNRILPITPGQIYETNGFYGYDFSNDKIPLLSNFYILLKDNEREFVIYSAHYFVTLDEWRESQLNKVL